MGKAILKIMLPPKVIKKLKKEKNYVCLEVESGYSMDIAIDLFASNVCTYTINGEKI